jgi:superfamily II DNA/RNA helicase
MRNFDTITKFFAGIDFMEHSQSDIEHVYIEVAGDISAKPKALCDLIEAAGRPKTIIYCNNPSDTDLVEVFLRRRGIPCEKLIGNVPPRRLQGVMKEINSREICTLVVTDIAANNLPVEDFELAISHSSPSDPEIYLHRIGDTNSLTHLKRSLSLVAPSDLTNFQYLKKIVSFDFKTEELPSEKELLKSKLSVVVTSAANATPSPEMIESATEIISNENAAHLVAFLLEKFLSEKIDERPHSRRDRSGRRRHDDEDEEQSSSYRESRSDRDNADDSDDSYDNRPPRKSAVEMKKDSRFYIGVGSEQKFTQESLTSLLRNLGLAAEIEIERMSVRNNNSIIDVAEEKSEAVESILKGAKLDSGEALHGYLATSISSPKKVDPSESSLEEGEGDSNELSSGADGAEFASSSSL